MLEFDTPPPTPWLRLATGRTRWTGTLPALTATLREAPLVVPADYRDLCGLPRTGPVPVTWPQVAAAPLHGQLIAHPSFPLRAMGLVHVWQHCAQTRPLADGEPVALQASLDGHRPARRGVEVDLVTTATAGGEVVWTGRTRFLARSVPGDGVERPADDAVPGTGRRERWELPADLGRRYARIAGDRNPIHMYGWTAKLFGFERAIIHGMWTLARTVAAVDPAASAVSCTFRRPLLLPGTAELVVDDEGAFAVLTASGKPALVGRSG